ncbi:hypothetical protein DM02DRAFT_678390 [Periconia macrospinosa]|uniref:Uncharacterized protein n=1 Tax=Periconia macrospinosa TaxID=97972 RepID=A0A2V1D0M3_9PLEO|nr:hypothetical protein DM02DRAFT_678390 [Periconia macrospinosa]
MTLVSTANDGTAKERVEPGDQSKSGEIQSKETSGNGRIRRRRSTSREDFPSTKRQCVASSLSGNDDDAPIVSVDFNESNNVEANGPWATHEEIRVYRSAPKTAWPGCVPLFGRPSDLEQSKVVEERRQILAHIKGKEAKKNKVFESWYRLPGIEKQFTRWRNVGCQLCFATTGEPEPDHKIEECSSWDSCGKAREILKWLEKLDIPRFTHGLGSCSLCSETDCLCTDIQIAQQAADARFDHVREHYKRELLSIRHPDGHCQNKPVVRKTIAALRAYDDQVLGKSLAKRLRDENGIDIAAESQLILWFERRIPFRDSWVPRLLFVFEMLVWAFDFRRSRVRPLPQDDAETTRPRSIGELMDLRALGWVDEWEPQDWKEALDFWMHKCGFCAGRGLYGSHVTHTRRACPRGGREQLEVGLGEAFYVDEYKAKGGCRECGVPREMCQRWRKEEGGWVVDRWQICRYGKLVYDTVIGLYQCDDDRYRLDLDILIEEEGDEEYSYRTDEDVASWLCRRRTVAGIQCSEIIRQLTAWTRMVKKARLY